MFYLSAIFLFSFLLVKATDILVVNLKALSRSSKIGRFAITGFLIAFATSLPELFVGITSALQGQPNLTLGNIIGSNIADLSLVIGIAALVGGKVIVRGQFLRQDVFYAFLAGAAPLLLLMDKSLSRIDGLILLALYFFYQALVLTGRQKGIIRERGEDQHLIQRLIKKLNHKSARRELAWIFFGVAILLFSADMIVRIAKEAAYDLNIPILLIGLFVVSVGTSLPELAFQLKAVKEKEPQMVFGDLLGSVVANSTFIIGLVALISPLKIQAFNEYLLATMAFVVVFGLFYLFIKTKHRLDRWEGAFLLGFYLVFILVEFIRL